LLYGVGFCRTCGELCGILSYFRCIYEVGYYLLCCVLDAAGSSAVRSSQITARPTPSSSHTEGVEMEIKRKCLGVRRHLVKGSVRGLHGSAEGAARHAASAAGC
jgi:hypothetical protein